MSRPTKADQALLQIKVPRELHRALKHYAIEVDRDMSEIGAQLIEQYLRDHGQLPKTITRADRIAQPA